MVNVLDSCCGLVAGSPAPRVGEPGPYGDRVRLIGVDILDERDGGRAFMRGHGWTHPGVNDPGASIRDGHGPLGQPVKLFYDATGALVDTWTGPLSPDAFHANLDPILGPATSMRRRRRAMSPLVHGVISRRAVMSMSGGVTPFGGTYRVDSPVTPASASSRTAHRSIIGRPAGNGVASYTTSSCSAP